jgi:hypothetical protein
MNIKSVRLQFERHMERFYPGLPLVIDGGAFGAHPAELIGDIERKYQNVGVQVMWEMFLAGRMLQPYDGAAVLPPTKTKAMGFMMQAITRVWMNAGVI